MRRWIIALTAGLFALPAAFARADSVTSELDFDVNSISIQAQNAKAQNQFQGLNHTGEFLISSSSISTLGILTDGITDANLAGVQFSLTGGIYLDSGMLNHGSITITASNPQGASSSYTFDLVSGSGSLHQVGTKSNYLLTGSTDQGILTSSTLGGVDVSSWFNQQPLTGSFIQFYFRPNSKGYDSATNLDIATFATIAPPTIAVPAPEAIWGGLSLIGIFGGIKIYRRRNSKDLTL